MECVLFRGLIIVCYWSFSKFSIGYNLFSDTTEGYLAIKISYPNVDAIVQFEKEFYTFNKSKITKARWGRIIDG